MELENLSKRAAVAAAAAGLPRLPKRGEALILASRTFEKQPRDDNNMTSRLMGETFCMSLPYGSQYPLHAGCVVVVVYVVVLCARDGTTVVHSFFNQEENIYFEITE